MLRLRLRQCLSDQLSSSIPHLNTQSQLPPPRTHLHRRLLQNRDSLILINVVPSPEAVKLVVEEHETRYILDNLGIDVARFDEIPVFADERDYVLLGRVGDGRGDGGGGEKGF